MSQKEFPTHARVVIVGGGVMGVGLAYHLGKEGWPAATLYPGVALSLIDHQGQVLSEAVTDGHGYAELPLTLLCRPRFW